jgi:hypothetical protein
MPRLLQVLGEEGRLDAVAGAGMRRVREQEKADGGLLEDERVGVVGGGVPRRQRRGDERADVHLRRLP